MAETLSPLPPVPIGPIEEETRSAIEAIEVGVSLHCDLLILNLIHISILCHTMLCTISSMGKPYT